MRERILEAIAVELRAQGFEVGDYGDASSPVAFAPSDAGPVEIGPLASAIVRAILAVIPKPTAGPSILEEATPPELRELAARLYKLSRVTLAAPAPDPVVTHAWASLTSHMATIEDRVHGRPRPRSEYDAH